MMEPDLHAKDVEMLLRGFAMLIDGENYKPSMTKFLNQFAKRSKANGTARNNYLRDLHQSFLNACSEAPDDLFLNPRNRRFNVALFEAVFTATCRRALTARSPVDGHLDVDSVNELSEDTEFLEASQKSTTTSANVSTRLARARTLIRFV